MSPAAFQPYFLASASAGGALIGLLFIAISIAPEHTFGKDAAFERKLIASSAFTALVNAFFISLGALLPDTTFAALGGVSIAMGAIGLLNTLYLGWDIVDRRGEMSLRRSMLLVMASLAIYGGECGAGVTLVRPGHTSDPAFVVAELLLAVYGIGIMRAWQLLGGEHSSLIGQIIALIIPERPNRLRAADTHKEEAVSAVSRSESRDH
jgi:hypothetical protein